MDTLLELGKQVPSLAVLVVVVWIFVRHIETTQAAFRDTVKDIHASAMTDRAETREVMRENTTSAKQNTTAVNDLASVIKVMEAKR